jgi:hypothetical protein
MNYIKLIAEGEVLGFIAVEPGSPNELLLVDKALEMGYKLEAATEEEYDSFDAEEISNH